MAEKEKKQEEMKRRDFLFKAAEAAALALFGGMGLTEVTKAVTAELQRRTATEELATQVAKELNAYAQRVDKCKGVTWYECGPGQAYQDRLNCGKFRCWDVFTCIGGDFSCGEFRCETPNRFRCYGYTLP